jgi:hypothetical protein
VTLPRIAARLAPATDTPEEQACCCYHQLVVETWAGLPPATGGLLARWRLFAGQSAWSPIDAVVEVGVGTRMTAPVLGRWHSVQIWRGTPFAAGVSGHTFLWFQSDGGWGWQLDCVIGRRPDQRARAWADVVAEAVGGLAIAVLRRPRDGAEG